MIKSNKFLILSLLFGISAGVSYSLEQSRVEAKPPPPPPPGPCVACFGAVCAATWNGALNCRQLGGDCIAWGQCGSL